LNIKRHRCSEKPNKGKKLLLLAPFLFGEATLLTMTKQRVPLTIPLLREVSKTFNFPKKAPRKENRPT
jgi:hypothetical protein